jgi:hypothetical protein
VINATARRIRRYSPGTGKVDPKKFPRNHFAELGVDRTKCHGASYGARVCGGLLETAGYIAIVFHHPTKKRTKGRMCWAFVARPA